MSNLHASLSKTSKAKIDFISDTCCPENKVKLQAGLQKQGS